MCQSRCWSADANGILEASRNEDSRPVPVKMVAQQVLRVAALPALVPPFDTPC
jgi:hypothetical protein